MLTIKIFSTKLKLQKERKEINSRNSFVKASSHTQHTVNSHIMHISDDLVNFTIRDQQDNQSSSITSKEKKNKRKKI